MKKRGRHLKRYLGLRSDRSISISGGIEHLLPGLISGWVVARDIPLQDVRLLIGPHLIARAEVNQSRPDVCQSLGIQGSPGFLLKLPAELPALDWQDVPRLLAMSADGSHQFELDLLANPKLTSQLLKTLLRSDLLGLEGHFDGLIQGELRGWAGRRGQHDSTRIWLQAPGQRPWPVICDQWRDGMINLGLPERSGFSLKPAAMPAAWTGLEVFCSFDQEGQFRLPQVGTVVLPQPAHGSDGIGWSQSTQELAPLISNEKSASLISAMPENLQEHWQMLENFRLYLDQIEQELDAREKNEPQQRSVTRGRAGWWSKWLGSQR
jgi:hypothetical protein